MDQRPRIEYQSSTHIFDFDVISISLMFRYPNTAEIVHATDKLSVEVLESYSFPVNPGIIQYTLLHIFEILLPWFTVSYLQMVMVVTKVCII
jgi:hypothetical protein